MVSPLTPALTTRTGLPSWFELPAEERGIGLVLVQTQAGGQAVAQEDDQRRGRCAGAGAGTGRRSGMDTGAARRAARGASSGGPRSTGERPRE